MKMIIHANLVILLVKVVQLNINVMLVFQEIVQELMEEIMFAIVRMDLLKIQMEYVRK